MSSRLPKLKTHFVHLWSGHVSSTSKGSRTIAPCSRRISSSGICQLAQMSASSFPAWCNHSSTNSWSFSNESVPWRRRILRYHQVATVGRRWR
jgi:hypothetical protein